MELRFAGAAPEVHPGRCLNRRHAGAGCTRCVDGCPVQAITLAGATPQLDADACVRCGLCVSTCPTDSFTPAIDYERKLLETVAALPQTPIALVCAAHPTPAQSAAKVEAIVQHRRCLAALDVADWITLSAGGTRPLWLDDSPCADCPIGAAQATLARTVEAARTLLKAACCPPALLLHNERPPAPDAKPRHAPLYDGAQPAISRRSLFTRLRPAQSQSEEPALNELFQRGAPLSARLPQQTPASRRRLLTALASRQSAETSPFATQLTPFGVVEVDAAHCSGCGLCARFCPTGALDFTVDTDHFALSFQASACIACEICVVACPEKVVHQGESLALDAILMDRVTRVAAGEVVACEVCGIPTARRADEVTPRCHVCRRGAGVVTAQRDEAGLMADLLKRTRGPGA